MIIKNTAMRDALIELTETRMKIEKVVKEKETHFTMAQVGDLFRRKLITEEKARELWAKLGFADWEIELLVQRYAPPS
jgi:trans-2-enoyl-CoA reductase